MSDKRKFEKIVVNYPPKDTCIYPEYIGKPYFSIKYEENGEHIVGFGTYNPEVLSRYLQEYFIAPSMDVRYKPVILQEHDAESRRLRAILDTETEEIYICKLTKQGADILGITIEEVE